MLVNGTNLTALFTGFDARFSAAYAKAAAESFIDKMSMQVDSKTSIQSYAWMGKIPQMREWVGSREIQNLTTRAYSLANRKFEETIGIGKDEIDDDQFGTYAPVLDQLAISAAWLYDQIAIPIIQNGNTTTTSAGAAYDGVAFFSTVHPKDPDNSGAGTQSNRLTSSGLSAETLDNAKKAMREFVGANGRTYGITPDTLIVPAGLETLARTLIQAPVLAAPKVSSGGATQVGSNSNTWLNTLDLIVVPDLGIAGGAQATNWYLASLKGALKPFVKQVREPATTSYMVNPTDYSVFMQDQFNYGVRARGAVGYAFWQTMVRGEA